MELKRSDLTPQVFRVLQGGQIGVESLEAGDLVRGEVQSATIQGEGVDAILHVELAWAAITKTTDLVLPKYYRHDCRGYDFSLDNIESIALNQGRIRFELSASGEIIIFYLQGDPDNITPDLISEPEPEAD